ncbi:hypothetical protein SISNIDRAFT_454790 [Sistotremastrum niveocremeum HHB9708]|uniref:UspA domain-containing protein n=2 Tax=Sistotremastraceae TaxID=3402574 RepID=A0A164UVM7_9AGAM|nr:hypothetical protein SISNIDRAFT_454790 [Sistotremastrum niveocremeum HHB9708]KZT42647.1 hypothetical protein SISSUDRAFT_1041258 [Sistotremastrum suecicum HHB10207 ss-3]
MSSPKLPQNPRRRSWIGLQRKDKDKDKEREKELTLIEGVVYKAPQSGHSTPRASSQSFSRSQSSQSISSLVSEPSPESSTPPISYALQRTSSAPQAAQDRLPNKPDASPSTDTGRPTSGFTKLSLTSMLTLGLVKDKSDETERGRSTKSSSSNARRSSPAANDSERSVSRGRSTSPFRLRSRSRARREASPSSMVEALRMDAESDNESTTRVRPRNAFSAGDDSSSSSGSGSEESWSEGDADVDFLTGQNTEANAAIANLPVEVLGEPEVAEPDPLGEGVNVIVPPEPFFPSTQFSTTGTHSNPRRRKSTRIQDPLPLDTSRPQFARDRCTIALKHGDPESACEAADRSGRTYIVCSDLSEESRYAVEWGIGTVLRDGDDMMIVTVAETDNKLDPVDGSQADRVLKLRSQQERQTLAYLLARQVTGLLQRTKLNVNVICQAWHAKNARHMLLDLIDHVNPTMVIVGSRGMSKLKGILLGSTSHYLIQKSSVPVMVARRRLKRPARKSAHLATHRARVSLAEAAIDKVGPGKVDNDVAVMRDELQRDDARREADLRLAGADRGLAEEDEEDELEADAELAGSPTSPASPASPRSLSIARAEAEAA